MALSSVAALYDIHGNVLALEAALAAVLKECVDAIVIGGDVAWGPEPKAVVRRLMGLGTRAFFVRGNTDREIVDSVGRPPGENAWVADVNRFCRSRLDDSELAFLAGFKEQVALPVRGLGEVLFVHGSPRSDNEAIRRTTLKDALRLMLEGISQGVIVCGHTHVAFDRRVLAKRIVNPGSVGLHHAARGACWAMFGPDVVLRETAYDAQQAAQRARLSGVPVADAFAEQIAHPPLIAPFPESDVHSLFVPD